MANKNQAPAYPGHLSKDCPWKPRPRTVLGRVLGWVFLLEKVSSYYFIPKSSPRLETERLKELTKFIYQEYYLNPRRTWKSLEEYLQFYNYERIHLGKYLNGMISVEKWQKYLSTVSPLKVN
ncbi:hypothetical protein A2Z61_00090 [Candidatus Campbellbacteria bacterium RIFCSPLOWO2_02_35_12]|uniref:Uncharacterized protein n=1 Tax=Candidatus Campbellbacteria bacterium RIFCSPLOWO2_02_35_12 TaxID=1797580 RepID=A0A1F5EK67_9BACT|nr:MAG: hypothetical protein A2Z61_00090 [Candidatus Campbellbacteria bacterium RIFCSPLOWO2_02_35_12]